ERARECARALRAGVSRGPKEIERWAASPLILGGRRTPLETTTAGRLATTTRTLVLVAQNELAAILGSFALERPIHDVADRVLRGFAAVNKRVDLLGNSHLASVLARQRQERRGGIHAFRRHSHAGDEFGKPAPLPAFDAYEP